MPNSLPDIPFPFATNRLFFVINVFVVGKRSSPCSRIQLQVHVHTRPLVWRTRPQIHLGFSSTAPAISTTSRLDLQESRTADHQPPIAECPIAECPIAECPIADMPDRRHASRQFHPAPTLLIGCGSVRTQLPLKASFHTHNTNPADLAGYNRAAFNVTIF